MTSLVAVAAYLPPQSVPISELGAGLGVSRSQIKVFERFFGLSRVRVSEEGPSALLLRAVAELAEKTDLERDRIKYVVQARSMGTVAPYPINPVHEVRASLGLDRAEAFAVSQHACASGLLAVDMCGRLLAAEQDESALALVLAGEKTFTRVARMIPRTTFNGEGAAAVLVSGGGTRDRVVSYVAEVDGSFSNAVSLTKEMFDGFQVAYVQGLVGVMNTAVQRVGLTMEDIDLVLPHNINLISWKRACDQLGYDISRVYLDEVPEIGHSFCADPFINYVSADQSGLLPESGYLMLVSVGMGATFSAMVVQR